MNDQLLSLELAEVLKADAEFAGRFTPEATEAVPSPVPLIHGQLDGTTTGRPCLNISGVFTPYGPRRKGTVEFEVLTRAGDTSEQTHHMRFDALYDLLLGAQGANAAETAANRAAAMDALKTAIAARSACSIVLYGPASEGTIEAGVEREDLRTVLRLAIVWQITPPA